MKYFAVKKQYNDYFIIFIYAKNRRLPAVDLFKIESSPDYDLYKPKIIQKYNINIDNL